MEQTRLQKEKRLAGLIKRKADELIKIEALQAGQTRLEEIIEELELELSIEE